MKRNRTGRILLMSVAALTTVGGFVADWNRTHLFNPRWTPHSKFHSAWTILLGSMLGVSGLYLLQKRGEDQQMQLRWGTLLPAFYWAAQAGSFAFPGARGLEAEFPDLVPSVGPIRLNEAPISILMLSVLGIGYVLEKKARSRRSWRKRFKLSI